MKHRIRLTTLTSFSSVLLSAQSAVVLEAPGCEVRLTLDQVDVERLPGGQKMLSLPNFGFGAPQNLLAGPLVTRILLTSRRDGPVKPLRVSHNGSETGPQVTAELPNYVRVANVWYDSTDRLGCEPVVVGTIQFRLEFESSTAR